MDSTNLFLEYHEVPIDDEVDNFLAHHGILGQKWGIRRFQNEDGTRTPLGKKHEAELDSEGSESSKKKLFNIDKKTAKKIAIGVGVGLAGAALIGGASFVLGGGVDLDNVANFINRVAPHAEKTPIKEVSKKKPSSAVLDIINANKEAKATIQNTKKSIKVPTKIKNNKIASKALDAATKSTKSTGLGKKISNYRNRRAYQKAINAATAKSMADATDAFSRDNIREFLDKMNYTIELSKRVGR